MVIAGVLLVSKEAFICISQWPISALPWISVWGLGHGVGHLRVWERRPTSHLWQQSDLARVHELLNIVQMRTLPVFWSILSELASKVQIESPIEFGILRLEMGPQTTVSRNQVTFLLFVHFFINHIGFCDAERSTSTPFMDIRCMPCRLDACFYTAVATSGSGNIGSLSNQ